MTPSRKIEAEIVRLKQNIARLEKQAEAEEEAFNNSHNSGTAVMRPNSIDISINSAKDLRKKYEFLELVKDSLERSNQPLDPEAKRQELLRQAEEINNKILELQNSKSNKYQEMALLLYLSEVISS